MNNKYFVTIGLEIHIVLNTNTKMFSPAKSTHEDTINNHLNEIDLALPGSMPSVNENAVRKGIVLANALHMQIHTNPITFDRKNYFYWDLPKNFQITQQFNPIGTNGYVILDDENQTKISIERIQLEEDTAKQLKVEGSDDLKLNYNRAGLPLIEIVSNPVMHSSNEVELYLKALREICVFMDVSDAKMEEGSMRVDVNISLSKDEHTFGTKVEIKNINSITNAKLAAEYEIKRQSEILDKNELVQQETRRFDDHTLTTVFMRKKADAIDYRYMTEPNILAIYTPESFVHETLKTVGLHPYELKQALKQNNINQKDINLLLSNKKIYDLFQKAYSLTSDYKDASRWVLNELMGVLNKQEKTIEQFSIDEENDLLNLIKDFKANKFNSKQAKDLFNEVFLNHKAYNEALKTLMQNSKSYSDEDILKMINEILINNPNTKQELTTRYEKAEKFIIGSLMKQTKGQIDPLKVKEILNTLK